MTLSLLLALIATAAGLYSAWFWWRSAQVRFENKINSVMMQGQRAIGEKDVQTFFNQTARLNMHAASASAIAVLFSTLSALASAWSP